MLYNTKGIVLRSIKYGETSLIVNIYTELFGIQSYLINGVRKASKRTTGSAASFQPAALLELVVYHNELKQLQRIKEFQWAYLYEHVFFDVKKNAVALFMVELLQKSFKQPEKNEELFYFIEDAFIHLDKAEEAVVANFPLYFALHLTVFFGFRIEDNSHHKGNLILDLEEGVFTSSYPSHQHYLEGLLAETTALILKTMQPAELEHIKLNQATRRQLLQAYEDFYALHLPEFGRLKTLPVLQELLS
ncbi:MAG TPA: DNA repair protein RecO [Chitinophagaceae bacterium]|nr:DNA repair protein RecO [Chitinophagaceae bacterium]